MILFSPHNNIANDCWKSNVGIQAFVASRNAFKCDATRIDPMVHKKYRKKTFIILPVSDANASSKLKKMVAIKSKAMSKVLSLSDITQVSLEEIRVIA